MDFKLRMYLAELVGTFVLVYIGAGAVCAAYLPGDSRVDVTTVALAEGFTYAVLLTVTLLISTGCLNPAITLMLWVFRRLGSAQAGWLILMQLLGATLAGLAVRWTFADEVLTEARCGAPHLKAFLGPGDTILLSSLVSGVGIEILLTALVTVAFFASVVDRRGPRLGGVLIGLAQAAAILFGFHLTGGAANPARWFGPAIWQLTLTTPGAPAPLADHLVYWAGPILGALLGAFVYTTLILPAEKK
jgi:glycerol uptake facilitator-like aquaporin